MKATTRPVIVDIEFDDHDVVIDKQWYSVGIRRRAYDKQGSLWFVTPPSPLNMDMSTYTDEEMKTFIMDGKFLFVGDYEHLRFNAPEVG